MATRRIEYSLSLVPLPSTKTRRDTPKKKSNATPTEPRMITPAHRLKFQIKNQLNMVGGWPEAKPMQQLTDAIFKAVFNSGTAASIRDVMFEIREQEKLMEVENDDQV